MYEYMTNEYASIDPNTSPRDPCGHRTCTMACSCIDASRELELKPIDLSRLISAELSLPDNDDYNPSMKPKEIVALAHAVLLQRNVTISPSAAAAAGVESSVKDDARSIRRIIRSLPLSFWIRNDHDDDKDSNSIRLNSNSTPEALVTRLLLKPPSSGGFCTAVACRRLVKNRAVDTKSIYSYGSFSIDGFSILPHPGQYSTLDTEMEHVPLVLASQRTVLKFNHTAFTVQSPPDRRHDDVVVPPGCSLFHANGNKCSARLVAYITPKACLVGFYQYAGPESELQTLKLLDELRLELSGGSKT